jgi:hypothetical protein
MELYAYAKYAQYEALRLLWMQTKQCVFAEKKIENISAVLRSRSCSEPKLLAGEPGDEVSAGHPPYFNRTFAYEIYMYYYGIYFYSSVLLQTVYTSP